MYSKTCVKRPLSTRPKIGFQDLLSLNAGHTYCRMLQGEHSAILSTFIKLPIVIKFVVLSIVEWSFYTGFTVSRPPIHLLHRIKSILCYEEEGPVSMNEMDLRSKILHFFIIDTKF